VRRTTGNPWIYETETGDAYVYRYTSEYGNKRIAFFYAPDAWDNAKLFCAAVEKEAVNQ
jgi:hypothetical protein